MSLKEILLQEVPKVEAKLKEFFEKISTKGTFTNDFLYQFYSDLANYLLHGGKRLRPISLVMIYKGLGGQNDAIYDIAISVELLHNASLVHDDIIDHDLVRRGQPSFHAFYSDWFNKNLKKFSDQEDFGLAMGILGGNLLVDLGLKTILDSDFPPDRKLRGIYYYIMAYKQLIDGVTAESYLQNIPLNKVSEKDYLDMINGKTAALFEKSILLGALFVDSAEKYEAELSKFAILLGQAFQIQDDILGVFGDPAKTGKSIEGDIREGKKTLLAIYANENSEFIKYYGTPNLTQEQIKLVRQLLKDTGALDKAKTKALELAKNANAILEQIELTRESFAFFHDLVMFVRERIA
ncbi:MAG: polyprenyl synthetase family protein [Candidatus Helarchaeota archaeon]